MFDVVNNFINTYKLVHYFYENFLIEQLKEYIFYRTGRKYNNFEELYEHKNELYFMDSILVETLFEVGEESYFDLFKKVDYSQQEKVSEIVEEAKKLFMHVHDLKIDQDDKLEQYYNMFKIIGPYLKRRFKEEGLFFLNENEKLVLEEVNVEQTKFIYTLFDILEGEEVSEVDEILKNTQNFHDYNICYEEEKKWEISKFDLSVIGEDMDNLAA
jgi:hypothetical protein